tara:strand:+ start:32 stop:229 length:198 start_codon:yes stop_codon:yes gene_type:complete
MKKKQKQKQIENSSFNEETLTEEAKVLILQEELINIRMEIIQVLKSHQESFEMLSKDLETFRTLH